MNRKAVARPLALAVAGLLLLVSTALAAGTRVTGQVVDAETLKPISNADVELQNSGGGPGYFRTRSDANGDFAIADVATNRWYLFTVGADGFTDFALESWQFPSAQRDVRIVVPLDRAGRMTVVLVAADGKTPVAGGKVSLQSERTATWQEGYRRNPEPKWTAKDGTVTFDGLTAGAWTVSTEAAGLRSGESRGVQVKRGETTKLPLTMTRPASLMGSVRLADSTGVAGVSVIARGPAEAMATTDAGGFYTLGDLEPGKWRIEVAHDGLEPGVARDGLVLREGESRDVPALRVTPRPAALAFVMSREVFPPTEKQSIGLRSFRLGVVDLVLWRLPEARLLDPARDFRAAYVQGADTTGLVRVESWRHETPNGPPFAWREEMMALPHEQPAGAYVLEARAGKLVRRTLFFVSDLSLLVKRTPTRTLVWAGSLKTGLPLAGVTVMTAGGSKSSAADGGRDWATDIATARGRGAVTDADGLLELPNTGDARVLRVVGASDGHGVAVAEPPLAGAAREGGDRIFLFTERPIYRPGQPIDWKLFARAANGNGWNVPAAGDVTLSLTGPDDASIEVPGATLSASGAADGTVTVPADAPLGDWTLQASWGQASTSAPVAIEQYRKPEYQVKVTPEREVVVNGDEVRFHVAANYFFGAPVVGATVRYTLFESRIRGESLWEDESFEDGEESGGYGRMLESGETRTDVDGRVSVAFTPARVAYDRKLSLEVEVVDGSQRTVSSRGTVVVGRGLYVVSLRPVRPVVLAGQPMLVDVITKDHLGRPVQAAVTLEVDQDVWNPLERRMTRSSRPLVSLKGTTSALQGTTRLTVSPSVARAGNLVVRAFSDDARGNRITAEASVWVYDDKVWAYPYRYPSLEALVDRDTLAVGDTAHVLVNTDVKDASVLVTVEGKDLHQKQVLHLFGNSGMVAVPIRAEYAPNVFVAVHVRRGSEVHTRVLELGVRAERHDLAISLTPDRAQYRPRETAHFQLETRDASGKPVPAEVAVGVVDEAIYALRADATPDAHDIFYGRRANWVATVVSFPTLYYGGADKGDHGDVRKDFRDVALWAPVVRTGADGRADVPVTFPDNLTTWRATARGMTASTLVGATRAKALVTKDVVARLAVPRAFVAGDEASLVSVVTNRGVAPLTGVDESLEAQGAATVAAPAHVTSSMAAGGESRQLWSVTASPTAPKDGSDAQAAFTFRAKSKGDSDALEQVVPVRPKAVPLVLHGAGVLAAGSGSVTVTLPPDLVRAGSSVTVEVAGSPAASALAAANWLGGYPYGCTEQTSNAILPGAALVTASRAAKVELPGWDDPGKRLGPFVEHLLALREDDGGWGWWKTGESDAYFTSLAVEALARAAAADVQRDECVSAAAQSVEPLQRLLAGVRSVDGEAYCAAHLSAALDVPETADAFGELRATVDALARSAASQRDQLGTSGLACAALAAQRLGRGADAKALLDAAMAKAVTRGDALAFPAADDGGWWNDESETAGYALAALARIAPADPRGPALVRGLLARRAGSHWRSTRVTGVAATALADWLLAHPAELAGGGTVKASWNGKAALATDLGPAGRAAAPARAVLPGTQLQPGANTLALEHAGGGPLWWAWEARALVPSPGPATDATRLAVRREYRHALRVADRRGRPRWLTTPVDEQNPIRVGEVVMVRLVLTAPKGLEHVMVEDPKPAGFEIEQVLPDGGDRPWDTWAEARDERASFFVSDLEAGATVIEYLIRPEIAGAFTALPSSAGPMYDPDVLVRGSEARLRVVAR